MTKRGQRTLAITALAIALIATTVAYAALQTTLKINGTVTRKGGTWNIALQNVANVVTTGTASMGTPTISGESISFSPTLNAPGDSISFTFDIVNTGDIDAKLTNTYLRTAGGTTYTDSEIIINDIIMRDNIGSSISSDVSSKVTYSDGSNMQLGDILTKKGGTKTVKITISYNDLTNDELPETDLTLDLTYYFSYQQAN